MRKNILAVSICHDWWPRLRWRRFCGKRDSAIASIVAALDSVPAAASLEVTPTGVGHILTVRYFQHAKRQCVAAEHHQHRPGERQGRQAALSRCRQL